MPAWYSDDTPSNSTTEGEAFMRDIRRLSVAVQAVTGATKLNYEVHGNTIPHLHMHFYPRYLNDPFMGRPISSRAVNKPVYAPGEINDLGHACSRRLAAEPI